MQPCVAMVTAPVSTYLLYALDLCPLYASIGLCTHLAALSTVARIMFWQRTASSLSVWPQIAVEVVRRTAVSVAGGMMSANAVASGQCA